MCGSRVDTLQPRPCKPPDVGLLSGSQRPASVTSLAPKGYIGLHCWSALQYCTRPPRGCLECTMCV